MIALGLCNVGSCFVGSLPVAASFSTAAVNSASGVRTTLGGAWTGAMVILALAVAMPYCAYIPKAALAAVVVTAVIFNVTHDVVAPMWRSSSRFLFK